jgi:SAM-dependent methyltransferase
MQQLTFLHARDEHQTPVAPQRMTANGLSPDDRIAHDWYRFVLSFPPALVRQYIEKFGLSQASLVLDPFCGTGTTLVECKKLGIPSVGIEANPMGYFASVVKTDWQPDSRALSRHASGIAERVTARLASEGIDDDPMLGRRNSHRPKLRTLAPDIQKLLLTNSISPLPLHKALVVLEEFQRCRQTRCLEHEKLALAKALVYSISNLRFGPEVGLGAIREDAPVIGSWMAEVRRIARDLDILNQLPGATTQVHQSDSRAIGTSLPPRSIDAVITSPPYPNEKDYTRTTRLETVLLGFVSNKQQLRALKQTLIRSNTRGVYKSDRDDDWVRQFPVIQEIAAQIEKRRKELGKTSGFERLYARVSKLYFGGIARHLSELRSLLRPGAQLAYVVGDQASYLRVMIRTGQLLAEIADSLGYEVLGIDLFRTRLATATREYLREEVVLLKWTGKRQ